MLRAAVALGAAASLIASAPGAALAETYNPTITPSNFTTNVTNPYFFLATVGREMEYRGNTEDGLEEIEIEVSNQTRVIMGVTTRVVVDTVWVNGELHEVTRDYFAQNKATGDVWYFGENVDFYENGRVVSHEGTWIAGVNGAKPGIIFKANPKVGDTYRQEYAPHVDALGMAKVLAVGQTITVPEGTFTQCVKTLEWNPADPEPSEEHKWNCKGAGGLVQEKNLETADLVKLVDINID